MVSLGPLKCDFQKSSHVTQKNNSTIFPIFQKINILCWILKLLYNLLESKQSSFSYCGCRDKLFRVVQNKKILKKITIFTGIAYSLDFIKKSFFFNFLSTHLHIFTQGYPSKLKWILWCVFFNIDIALKNKPFLRKMRI